MNRLGDCIAWGLGLVFVAIFIVLIVSGWLLHWVFP